MKFVSFGVGGCQDAHKGDNGWGYRQRQHECLNFYAFHWISISSHTYQTSGAVTVQRGVLAIEQPKIKKEPFRAVLSALNGSFFILGGLQPPL